MDKSDEVISERLIVGCMTGTSMDGLDAALVRVQGRGLEMRAEFVRGISRGLGELGIRLRRLADQEPMAAGEIACLMRDFALLHAEAIHGLIRGEPSPALVSVHGQTVFHAPPVSWQMFNPSVLAHAVGAPVVSDLRAADLAAGGQGAPITPLADWILFRCEQPTAVVNLGGFCNATLLPGAVPGATADAMTRAIDSISGFDVCACNHVLDRIARQCLGLAYDAGGASALSGTVDQLSRDELAAALGLQARSGRSLGTGDETGRWIETWRTKLSGNDMAATACAAIGHTIADRLRDVSTILAAGGGAYNVALLGAIREGSGAELKTTCQHGVPIEFREAAEMAVLGALCADRVPITLPRVTGVNHGRNPAPIAGVWAGISPELEHFP